MGILQNTYWVTACISLLTNFVMVQSVRHLDVAIDMHISLVQMRQNVRAGLADTDDLRFGQDGMKEAKPDFLESNTAACEPW